MVAALARMVCRLIDHQPRRHRITFDAQRETWSGVCTICGARLVSDDREWWQVDE